MRLRSAAWTVNNLKSFLKVFLILAALNFGLWKHARVAEEDNLVLNVNAQHSAILSAVLYID